MRYSLKHLLLFLTAALFTMMSCRKSENKIIYEGGEAPALTASVPAGSVIPLNILTKTNKAVIFNWTNPDYKFNTGVNSQNVNYTLQVDKAGLDFSGSDIQERSFTSDLSGTLTQDDLNKMLIQLGFDFDQEATFEVRIKAFLGDGSVPLYSNVLTFKAVPYLDVVVPLPTTGKLYIVGGDVLLGKWGNGGDYAVQNQEFTRDDLTTYSITIEFSGGDNTEDEHQFLFIPLWGNWDHKFACNKTSEQPETGGKFGFDFSSNFPAPSAAGTYKIVVDFKFGTYTVTKL